MVSWEKAQADPAEAHSISDDELCEIVAAGCIDHQEHLAYMQDQFELMTELYELQYGQMQDQICTLIEDLSYG